MMEDHASFMVDMKKIGDTVTKGFPRRHAIIARVSNTLEPDPFRIIYLERGCKLGFRLGGL